MQITISSIDILLPIGLTPNPGRASKPGGGVTVADMLEEDPHTDAIFLASVVLPKLLFCAQQNGQMVMINTRKAQLQAVCVRTKSMTFIFMIFITFIHKSKYHNY